ncbi:magnesium transporter CorA family protein [Xylophilus ampelinus]|uniref:Mg2+ and Co2+ transporter CorA n=1 Tax=Xylophilus ampelinus TaxID=54067 RepID=A0A318SLA8_9BURK|nr:magnesium transporter CorA family protein [Xylophilus ampelinus]MCS4510723.1 magnesium transporter CorA family protein [Xylophilus ampelinus]PYE76302.1 Mg2+ and Co2+ transporter CorA [Xylophilus ampelinus]
MRIFELHGGRVAETDRLPAAPSPQGFYWIACSRSEFSAGQAQVQAALLAVAGVQLVELHVSDLLNAQLPSHYDYTSQYDLLVFRRLATQHGAAAQADGPGATPASAAAAPGTDAGAAAAPPAALRRVDTRPIGFAIFDQVLLTVHPEDCAVRDAYALRLLAGHGSETRTTGARQPASPADLMLRIVNLVVDGYLELRRDLTRGLDLWQNQLLQPHSRFIDWSALLDARLALHQLDEICEDQRAAVQDWIDALEAWPEPATVAAQRERDLLQVRSRDVLEHIERVVHHVRRMEQTAETTVQMHFSLQGNRTNDIMRVLTTLTAIFLPLNLIAGIFGMNFEVIPLTHKQDGFWWAMGTMAVIAVVLIGWFWRKKYLARPSR